MLRINPALRKLGATYVTCHEDHMTNTFGGGAEVIVDYLNNMDDLSNIMESELRSSTELYQSNIQHISYYVSDYGEQIKNALKQPK